MTTKTKIIVLLILIAIVYFFYSSIEQNKIEKKNRRLAAEASNIQNKLRFEKGAFVASENRISDYEVTKTIIYPGKVEDDYDQMYDSTCLIYINSKTNQTKMNCTGILFDKNVADN